MSPEPGLEDRTVRLVVLLDREIFRYSNLRPSLAEQSSLRNEIGEGEKDTILIENYHAEEKLSCILQRIGQEFVLEIIVEQ